MICALSNGKVHEGVGILGCLQWGTLGYFIRGVRICNNIFSFFFGKEDINVFTYFQFIYFGLIYFLVNVKY